MNLDERLLHSILSLGWIAQHAIAQVVDWVGEGMDNPGKCLVVARGSLLDPVGFRRVVANSGQRLPLRTSL